MNLPPNHRRNCRITILGQSGYGKTRLCRSLLEGVKRVVVLDYNREYDQWGYESLSVSEAGARLRSSRDLLYWRGRPLKWALYGMPGELLSGCRVVWALGYTCFVVEELDILCRSSFVPHDLFGIIHAGRHRAISLIATSRNAASIPKQVTSQYDAVVTFRQVEPVHLIAVGRYGFNPETVRNLDRDHYCWLGEPQDEIKKRLLETVENYKNP